MCGMRPQLIETPILKDMRQTARELGIIRTLQEARRVVASSPERAEALLDEALWLLGAESLRIVMLIVACLSVVWSGACASPTQPTTIAIVTRDLSYTINVPTMAATLIWQAAYPDGVRMAPVTAQSRFDYTPEYHGTPNVYAGATIAGGLRTYTGTGIVVAPYAVASVPTFPATAWPDPITGKPFGGDPNVEYAWLGRFVYAEYREN